MNTKKTKKFKKSFLKFYGLNKVVEPFYPKYETLNARKTPKQEAYLFSIIMAESVNMWKWKVKPNRIL